MGLSFLNNGDKVNDSDSSDDTSHVQVDDGSGNPVVTELHAPQHVSNLTPTLQYQLRTENGHGTVTYRVVQVASDCDVNVDSSGHVVTTAGALIGQPVAQTILTNYSSPNGEISPTSDPQTTDTRFAYFPAVTGAITDGGVATTHSESATLTTSSPGQFYIMMSPQDMLQPSQRTIAPRTHQCSPKLDVTRTVKDEQRKATHNEVERRRRDKINTWIMKLSKVVPNCTVDHTKQGQSKGGILAKTCDYIQELRSTNVRLPDILKENEQLSLNVQLLRQQCEDLKNENQMFRAHLQQQGITVSDHLRTNAS
ncbi:upstream stimulatory factor-like isoform X2 [Tachypleus tridentatus]|uniref:upstream stimulatory factor-like isoform X2 n=1 Tax=Tachypleus tridentatus TaxID=6853 RepID=UPI003FD28D47